jgi:hypothetical protein
MIKVGAATETEMKEKKARVEALLRAAAALENLKAEHDEQIGFSIRLLLAGSTDVSRIATRAGASQPGRCCLSGDLPPASASGRCGP